MFENHPHFTLFPGESVEIIERADVLDVDPHIVGQAILLEAALSFLGLSSADLISWTNAELRPAPSLQCAVAVDLSGRRDFPDRRRASVDPKSDPRREGFPADVE